MCHQMRIHHPRINATAALIRQLAAALKVQPYSQASGQGLLRYVQLTLVASRPGVRAEDDPSAAVQVVLVWAAAGPHDASLDLCRRLAQALWSHCGPGASPLLGGAPAPAASRARVGAAQQPGSTVVPASPRVHSIWVNCHADSSDNNVLGADGWEQLHGPDFAWQQFGGAAVALAPASFVQANYGAMQRCLQLVASHIPPAATVAELYAGAGVIGLHLLATCQPQWVRCVEVNAACRPAFEASAAHLPAQLASRIELHIASAGEQPATWLAGAEVLVADPPRKGLDESLLQLLEGAAASAGGGSEGAPGQGEAATEGVAAAAPVASASCAALRRFVYVSCGWRAFKTDCARLLGSGGWQLASGTALLFFPGSDAIETVAVFDRVL